MSLISKLERRKKAQVHKRFGSQCPNCGKPMELHTIKEKGDDVYKVFTCSFCETSCGSFYRKKNI
jgi:formamidopyrimidine-DNA glycosylase